MSYSAPVVLDHLGLMQTHWLQWRLAAAARSCASPQLHAALTQRQHPKTKHACFHTGTKLQRMAGLTEWIAWLRARGVRMAAVTNAPRANTELMLSALQLDSEFEVGWLSCSV